MIDVGKILSIFRNIIKNKNKTSIKGNNSKIIRGGSAFLEKL